MSIILDVIASTIASGSLTFFYDRYRHRRRERLINNIAHAMVRVYGDRAEREIEHRPAERLGNDWKLWAEVIRACHRARLIIHEERMVEQQLLKDGEEEEEEEDDDDDDIEDKGTPPTKKR